MTCHCIEDTGEGSSRIAGKSLLRSSCSDRCPPIRRSLLGLALPQLLLGSFRRWYPSARLPIRHRPRGYRRPYLRLHARLVAQERRTPPPRLLHRTAMVAGLAPRAISQAVAGVNASQPCDSFLDCAVPRLLDVIARIGRLTDSKPGCCATETEFSDKESVMTFERCPKCGIVLTAGDPPICPRCGAEATVIEDPATGGEAPTG
jgi:hypothetical protein